MGSIQIQRNRTYYAGEFDTINFPRPSFDRVSGEPFDHSETFHHPTRELFLDIHRKSPAAPLPAKTSGELNYYYAEGMLYSNEGMIVGPTALDFNTRTGGQAELKSGAYITDAENNRYTFIHDGNRGRLIDKYGRELPQKVTILVGQPPGTIRTFKEDIHATLHSRATPYGQAIIFNNHAANLAIYKKPTEFVLSQVAINEVHDLFSGRRNNISLKSSNAQNEQKTFSLKCRAAGHGVDYVYLKSSDGREEVRISKNGNFYELERKLHLPTVYSNFAGTENFYGAVGWVSDQSVQFQIKSKENPTVLSQLDIKTDWQNKSRISNPPPKFPDSNVATNLSGAKAGSTNTSTSVTIYADDKTQFPSLASVLSGQAEKKPVLSFEKLYELAGGDEKFHPPKKPVLKLEEDSKAKRRERREAERERRREEKQRRQESRRKGRSHSQDGEDGRSKEEKPDPRKTGSSSRGIRTSLDPESCSSSGSLGNGPSFSRSGTSGSTVLNQGPIYIPSTPRTILWGQNPGGTGDSTRASRTNSPTPTTTKVETLIAPIPPAIPKPSPLPPPGFLPRSSSIVIPTTIEERRPKPEPVMSVGPDPSLLEDSEVGKFGPDPDLLQSSGVLGVGPNDSDLK